MKIKKKGNTMASRASKGEKEKASERIAVYAGAQKDAPLQTIKKHRIKKNMKNKKGTKKKITKTKKTPTKKSSTKTIAKKKKGKKTLSSKKGTSSSRKTRVSASSLWKKIKIQTAPRKKMHLVHASEDSSFWVNDGPVLRNLLDLHNALGTISDEQYSHHVRDETDNDFARWVEDVLCDGECAVSLKPARDKRKAKKIIASRLRTYRT